MGAPLRLQHIQIPMQMPRRLVRLGGDADHAPHPFPAVMPQQLSHQFDRVQAVGLRAPPPAIDLDARRIDHDIVDPAGHQRAVDPEPVSAGFVAAPHRRVGRQAEPLRRPPPRTGPTPGRPPSPPAADGHCRR